MGRIRRSGRWFGAFTTLCAFLYAPNRWARKHHIRWTPALERRRQFVVGWLYLRAGALALAGLLAERDLMAGKCVAVIQTGGNADTGLLLQVLAGQTPDA